MPLFYQHNINQTTKLGIWKIEEPEGFFAGVPLQRTITHPHKRLQHLAGRWLLQHLFPDFPYSEIVIADTRKPYLKDEKYHFSISHTGNYAAAIVSSTQRVGIDIEFVSPKIEAISHKFMHETDRELIHSSNAGNYTPEQLLAFMWSAKESLFKWYSLGGVDFKEHLQLTAPIEQLITGGVNMSFICRKREPVAVDVKGRLFGEIQLALAWAAT
ncbi:MAG TPA: 4'-phosphopantetheinyl transferase superfamily protein [Chitinophagaceae bacterium]|nr:4'-phosphopantetheinyl transferase superfamily protein [Chitinophagaceae bacterium]